MATFGRRLGAYLIDTLFIFLVWYFLTIKDMASFNTIMETLDPQAENAFSLFVENLFQLYVKFVFKWIFVSTIIFVFPPAIVGDGKTIGKLLFGISVVDLKTGNEIIPIKLILREFIIRNLLESMLIIPFIVSAAMVIFRKDSRSIHDLVAGTIVIKKSYQSTI